MSGLEGIKVGDELIVSGYRGRMDRLKVEKIGRTLVHCERSSFYIESGHERSDYTPRQAFTYASWSEHLRRGQVIERLRELNVQPRSYGGFDYSTETLEAVVELLERAR